MKTVVIPNVRFEMQDDGTILLEQDHNGEPHFVELCPGHVKSLCELIDRPLVTRMCFLRERLAGLHADLASQIVYPDMARAPETHQSEKLLDLFDLFLDELGVPPVQEQLTESGIETLQAPGSPAGAENDAPHSHQTGLW